MFLNLRKYIYKKLTTSIIVNDERPKAFPKDEEQGKDVHFHHSYSTSYWRS